MMVPFMIYSDDTSGNKSKVWNKFDPWCYLLAGLPKKENAKLAVNMQEFKLLEDGIG